MSLMTDTIMKVAPQIYIKITNFAIVSKII